MNNEKSNPGEAESWRERESVKWREPGTSLWRINKARSSALVVALRAFRGRLSRRLLHRGHTVERRRFLDGTRERARPLVLIN